MFNRHILDYMRAWKQKLDRRPLVVRGARQVGKTFAVRLFGQREFEQTVEINLENQELRQAFMKVETLEQFERLVGVLLHQQIVPGKTLVFIDEIQNTPNLINLLRFFYEEKSEWHVVAAGSLLEVQIAKGGLSMPVGRVEYIYMYPLTFFEYLDAKGQKELVEYLQNIKSGEMLETVVHEVAMREFQEYAWIGGMPAAVAEFLKKENGQELETIYASLQTSYMEDVYKYATQAEIRYLTHVIDTAPRYAGTTVVYEKFGESGFKSREMSEAFTVLEKTMLVHQLPATSSRELPIVPKLRRSKKLLYLDVGLVNYKLGVGKGPINLKELSDDYRGRVAEQVVGQQLLAKFVHRPAELYYWAKEKYEGSAEVDFCYVGEGELVGVEVKSGSVGHLRSLWQFGLEVPASRLIRVYGGSWQVESRESKGQKLKLWSVPFYLVERIDELVV